MCCYWKCKLFFPIARMYLINEEHFKQPNEHFSIKFQLLDLNAVGEGRVNSMLRPLECWVPQVLSSLSTPRFLECLFFFTPPSFGLLCLSQTAVISACAFKCPDLFCSPRGASTALWCVHRHLWSPLERGCTHQRLIQHLPGPQLAYTLPLKSMKVSALAISMFGRLYKLFHLQWGLPK